MLLHLQLPARNTEGDSLEGDKDHGQIDRGPAGAAQGSEVGLRRHGDGLPPTRPAEEGVDGRRRVDGVEEDDGDHGGCESHEGGHKHYGRMERGVVSDLPRSNQLLYCASISQTSLTHMWHLAA